VEQSSRADGTLNDWGYCERKLLTKKGAESSDCTHSL
jgi:hypothetical protein